MIDVQENTSLNRNLTAAANGKTVGIATLSGQVTPGRGMMMSLVITDAALAAANHADVAVALDDFLSDLRAMAAENGLPV